jgi:hypothetical protein
MDVKIPNNGEWSTDRRNGSFPLAGAAGSINPPNNGEWSTDRMNGSFPLGPGTGPQAPPNGGLKFTPADVPGSGSVMPATKEGARLVNPGLGASPMPAWAMKGR